MKSSIHSLVTLKTLITLTKTGPWKNNYKEGEITIIPAEDIQNYFKRH